MKELFVPLSAAEVDSILDFIDRELIQQHILTAPRLCLLAAVEELFFAALVLASGQRGQVRCTLNGSSGVRISFQTERGAVVPDQEELYLPEGISLVREEFTYALAASAG